MKSVSDVTQVHKVSCEKEAVGGNLYNYCSNTANNYYICTVTCCLAIIKHVDCTTPSFQFHLSVCENSDAIAISSSDADIF